MSISITSILKQMIYIRAFWWHYHQRTFYIRTQIQHERAIAIWLARLDLFALNWVCREGIGWHCHRHHYHADQWWEAAKETEMWDNFVNFMLLNPSWMLLWLLSKFHLDKIFHVPSMSQSPIFPMYKTYSSLQSTLILYVFSLII
jgi:hypothetical protein